MKEHEERVHRVYDTLGIIDNIASPEKYHATTSKMKCTGKEFGKVRQLDDNDVEGCIW